MLAGEVRQHEVEPFLRSAGEGEDTLSARALGTQAVVAPSADDGIGVAGGEELGIDYQLKGIEPPTAERVENARRIMESVPLVK